MKRKLNLLNITAIILSIMVVVFFISSNVKAYSSPVELYRVYIAGETIGYIEDKDELEKYINLSQKNLKEKYKVENVYLPKELDISKEITFNKQISSTKDIYEKIVEKSDFSVDGYTITIKPSEKAENKEEIKIYVLDKSLFEESISNILKIFIKEEEYKKFIEDKQGELKGEGSLIEDIYINNNISIKKGKISTNNNIYTDLIELNRFLLYGEEISEKKYSVRKGDSISDVAFNNKLSVEEFLIVNPNFSSEKNLLSEGQKVNVSLPKPIIDVVEEEHVVEFQNVTYDTKIVYDEAYTIGYSKVTQEGENGKLKLTIKRQKVNGMVTSLVISNKEVIKNATPKIIVRGGKKVLTIGDLGIWHWPTSKPSKITPGSGFQWRAGKFHFGVDIVGPGCGGPIYAANNGVVDTAARLGEAFTGINGNYIYIDHNNGYFSEYAHLQSIVVQNGQSVEMGQIIGYMGNTGYSFGCHLHFGISRGRPGRIGSQYINPLYLVVY